MRIRDTLSSESEHVKSRAPGLLWRDLDVRLKRNKDDQDDTSSEWSESPAEAAAEKCQVEHEYTSYEMPDSSVLSIATFVPYAIAHSLRNMAKVFGWRFLSSIFVVYGVQQGMANSWFFQARDYYFKDVAMVDPADAQIYTAASQTPWNLKPVYGMTSDSLPIFGFHRIPYIMLAGAIGLACFSMLSSFRLTDSPILVVTLLFGVNLSVASPDVMVDGIIAERSRQYPLFASDLQSLCWGCMSVCAILAYLTSGYMIANFGSIAIFRILIASSAIIFVAGFLNWFGDTSKYSLQRQQEKQRQLQQLEGVAEEGKTELRRRSVRDRECEGEGALGLCCWGFVEYDKRFIAKHKNLFFLSAMISWCAIMLSVVMISFQDWRVRLTVLLAVFIFIAVTFFVTARRSGLPEVANAGLFIFLSNAVTPDIETAMFYWYTNAEEGPQFSPQFVGYISGLAFACMFAGILLYNRYLSTWAYRQIFASTMIFLAIMNLTDVVLVKRWNIAVGVPDEVMVLGDCALSPMARRFYIMPLYILAAKVCPPGAEATVFAILTALGNFGSSISVYFGSLVLQYFDIRDANYDKLVLVICLKCASRLLPLLLIPLLVPRGAPFEGPSEGRQKQGGYDSLEMESSHHTMNTSSASRFSTLSNLQRRVDEVIIRTRDEDGQNFIAL